MNWLYGDAHERFPIEPGEIWGLDNGSRAAVHNLFDPLPGFMKTADLVVVDPPWNLGNINTFYTKAGRSDYLKSFAVFADRLFQCIAEIAPRTVYIEIGNQNVDDFCARLSVQYPCTQRWPVLYYRKHPTWFVRGSHAIPVNHDFTGMDEAKCIEVIAQIETYTVVGDLCMGRGLVGLAAAKAGKPFVGTELNRRRLACLIDKLDQFGQTMQKI